MSDEIIPPDKALSIPEGRQQIADLWREIRQSPAGGGLLDRLKLKASVRNTRVLNELIAEHTQLRQGLASLQYAKLEYGRAREVLRDAQTIFAADADMRAADRKHAALKLKEAETAAAIRSMDLEMELDRKKREFEKFKKQRSGMSEISVDEPERPSQAEQELRKEFQYQNLANKLRLSIQMEIDESIRQVGGKQNVTPEMEALFERSRAAVERTIKENGLDR
jgi:hypothetical protein